MYLFLEKSHFKKNISIQVNFNTNLLKNANCVKLENLRTKTTSQWRKFKELYNKEFYNVLYKRDLSVPTKTFFEILFKRAGN